MGKVNEVYFSDNGITRKVPAEWCLHVLGWFERDLEMLAKGCDFVIHLENKVVEASARPPYGVTPVELENLDEFKKFLDN